MKYYEMHDDVYKGLRDKGYVSWGKNKNVHEMIEKSEVISDLKKHINDYFPNKNGPKALDLGTGTGTSALYLASMGFNCLGVDVSPIAIEMAQKNANELKLDAQFRVQDVNTLDTDEKFDLIVDSHFLHCIVPDEERGRIYSTAKKLLTPQGYLFIRTMVTSTDMSSMFVSDYFLLRDEILWSKGKEDWKMDYQDIDGKKMFPHRRIKNSASLEKEIQENGFEVCLSYVINSPTHPDSFVGWLRPRQ